MRRILVLRPEPGAQVTASKARQMGLSVDVVPLFDVEPVEWRPPEAEDFDGVLLTSANAVIHGGAGLASLCGLPVYAVGETTADAARGAGFQIDATGKEGVDHLLASVDPDLRLLHLCGADRREPAPPRQAITAISVYRAKAVAQPNLGDVANAIALIHSPRAARRLAELTAQRGQTTIAAISPAAAEAAGEGWLHVAAAPQPNDDALLALAARLCNKPHRDERDELS